MKTLVIAQTQVEGYHKWDKAPKRFEYLRNLHRHIFYITLKIEVIKSREIEFIDLKHQLERAIETCFPKKYHKKMMKGVLFGSNSCEMIALEILTLMQMEYPKNSIKSVSVYEDNENGAEIII